MSEAGGLKMPLSMVGSGEQVRVARVRGTEELRHHLANLSFVEGADVHVVSKNPSGIIVTVKGSRLGLDAKTAMHVMVG